MTDEGVEQTPDVAGEAPERPPEALPAPPEETPKPPAPNAVDEHAPPLPPTRPVRRDGPLRVVGRSIVWLTLLLIVVPPVSVLVYKVVPPPITVLMIERLIEGRGMDYRWRSLDQMSPALPEAAVASEDARFCSHHGFDFQAIQAAM